MRMLDAAGLTIFRELLTCEAGDVDSHGIRMSHRARLADRYVDPLDAWFREAYPGDVLGKGLDQPVLRGGHVFDDLLAHRPVVHGMRDVVAGARLARIGVDRDVDHHFLLYQPFPLVEADDAVELQ